MGLLSHKITLPAVPDEFEKFEDLVDYLNDLNQAVYNSVSELQEEFNGKIEIVNLLAKELSVSDTGTANTEFTVTHNIGRVPSYYIWNIDKAGIVYDSRRSSWTTEEMYLKCSVANSALKILIPF